MKFSLDNDTARYHVDAYSQQGVRIAGRWYRRHVMLTADRLIENWQPPEVSGLTVDDFLEVLEPAPDVVLLGTGKALHFPEPRLIAEFAQRSVGLEVMNTEAACRTFNILAGEGRPVVAALMIEL